MTGKRNIEPEKSNTDTDRWNPLDDAPLLRTIPKSNPFTVPEGYFDNLPSQIMAQCRENTKRMPSVNYNRAFLLFKPQSIFAVLIAVIALSVYLRREGNKPLEKYESIAATIPDSVLMASVQNNIAYVDVSALENMVNNQDEVLPVNIPDADIQDSSGGQIINYLINNNIDASDIEKEL